MSPYSKSGIVLLYALEETLARPLAEILGGLGYAVRRQSHGPVSEFIAATQQTRADVVFCASASKHYTALLRAVDGMLARPAMVVVSRIPEVSEWLDALEAGVTDYCGAPFEPFQVGWVMESALLAQQPR
jgi:CheY-like chemotaxis protein